ncbi:MAG TPA: ABC transporter ATP-binding protein [Ferruginibacter sp.]|mgnify:CR=1 FL=1|nr:ABC transporter ATP-binding protein [Ferruginibacter sp.]
MAPNDTPKKFTNPVRRILRVIRLETNEISSVYFYAILGGLIQLSLPIGIQTIINFVLGGSISTSLVILIIGVVFGVFLTGLLQVNQMKLIEKVQQKIFVRYALEFTDRIPRLNLSAIDGKYLPELVNRFFDTMILQKGIAKLLLDVPTATIQVIFGLMLLSFYHPVFIFFGLALILIVYLILRVTGARGMESSLEASDYKYAVAGWLEEMARVIRSFKFSRNTRLNVEKSDVLISGYLESRTNHFKVLLFQYWTLIALKVIITATMLIVGSILLVDQQLNIGQFIAAEIVILMVISSVEKIIVNLDKVYDVLTAVEKLGKVTDLPLEHSGKIELPSIERGVSIEMNQVDFKYQESDAEYTLKEIQLNIESNESICLMGRAGSGKSSLMRLLTGAFHTFKGSVLIDKIPIANYDLSSLRTQTGILLNQNDIFKGSLQENISMGFGGITAHEIMELADGIGLKKYIAGLPNGLDTPLQSDGTRLSKKIVQKILLMRALVHQPRLLLLEEPLEGIEDEPRRKILHYLFEQTKQQTMIISSNDPEIASKCDRVIYLEEGKIKAAGNWNQIKSIIH